ncbi:MAG: hypothetical protein Kow0010_09140 [Dehalococcoidia bacterium]
MAIDPITQLQNATYQPAAATPSQDLSSVDFMKLMIAQLRNQNPLEPTSDTDFMAQLAQFESLNQMRAVADGLKVMQSLNELSGAASLIGRTIVGKQVDAVPVTLDMVSRELFGTPFNQLNSAQKQVVTADDRVQEAALDREHAGLEVRGAVEKVVVGSDGIPMLYVGGKVVDLFTVAVVE